jgi:hypothetical protein
MKNELFDKFFGPPMNMPSPPPKSEGINFVLLAGGLLILVLLYKLNSKEIVKEKKDTVL